MAHPALILCVSFLFTATREQILERAAGFADLTWYADSANTVAWDYMYEEYGCPEHLSTDWDPGFTYQGMAYGYGQNDDTSEYLLDLEEDLAAGNHMCHYQNYGFQTGIYPPDWAAGIDCSAFVCRCWDVPRTNCTGLYENYHPVAKEDIQPGDILVKPGSHVVLVADPGQNPPYGTLSIYEASGSACRVWYNPAASWSAYSSYQAVSFFKQDQPDTVIDTLEDRFSFEPISKGTVTFSFPSADEAKLFIYNTLGQLICSHLIASGESEYTWAGSDEYGNILPSGVYYVAYQPSQVSTIQRLIFLR